MPIALRSVETGRWLGRHGAGLLIEDPLAELDPILARLNAAEYGRLRSAVAAIPRAALVADRADCDALMTAIRGS